MSTNFIRTARLNCEPGKFKNKIVYLQKDDLITVKVICVKIVQIRSFSGPCFPVFNPNTGIYGPKKPPNLGTFHAVGR